MYEKFIQFLWKWQNLIKGFTSVMNKNLIYYDFISYGSCLIFCCLETSFTWNVWFEGSYLNCSCVSKLGNATQTTNNTSFTSKYMNLVSIICELSFTFLVSTWTILEYRNSNLKLTKATPITSPRNTPKIETI